MKSAMVLLGGLILYGCSAMRYLGPYTKVIPVIVPRSQQIEQVAEIVPPRHER